MHGQPSRNLEDVKLHELSWHGWQNYNLRALRQGRYVSINLTRSIKDATFMSYFLQHLREQKLDLDQIAECFCVDSGIQVSSETPKHSKKTFRMKELAQFVVKQLQPYQTAELADAQDRIKQLERQLVQHRNRTNSQAEIGPEPISNSQSSQSDGTASDSKQFSLVVLPVAHMDTQRKLGTLEMTLIQRWNPSLNFPFILKKRISKVGPDYSFAIKQLAPGTGS